VDGQRRDARHQHKYDPLDHANWDAEEVGVEQDCESVFARRRWWQISEADDALHAGHDPGRGTGETDHDTKPGPEDESRRERQDGDRHDNVVVFSTGGEKDQVLRNIAAAAERRESKYGADRHRIEGE
jgi:hypothetical protein